MKIVLTLLLVLTLSVGSASAQTPTDPEAFRKALTGLVTQLTEMLKLLPPAVPVPPDPPPPDPVIPPVVVPPISSAVVVSTPAGLQTALNTVAAGTRIELMPGTYAGTFTLPKRPSTGAVTTITSSGLVLPEQRVSSSLGMATIYGDQTSAFIFAPGASYYRITGLRFVATRIAQNEIIRIGDTNDPNLANVPHHIEMDRNVFTGGVNGQKRAVAANGTDIVFRWNRCENIWVVGQDSQCISFWSTPGRIKILDNYMQVASEPFMVGGSAPVNGAFVPKDILIEGNYLTHKEEWRGPGNWQVKNLGEIKFGENITIRNNTFENHWAAAQPGWAIVFTIDTNTSRLGGCPECGIKNLVFENNIVRNVAMGINVNGHSYSNLSGQMDGLVVRNNLFVINSTGNGGNGNFMQIGGEPKNVIVENNTVDHGGGSFIMGYYGGKWGVGMTAMGDAGPIQGMIIRNNIFKNNEYGLFTPEGINGRNLLTFYPGLVMTDNVVVWNKVTPTYPAGNINVPIADWNTVVDVNYNVLPAYVGKGRK